MAKDPAFLFYSQDFYTGVATLNWEERGKFISILCLMHQQGRMKEETIRFLVGSVSDNLRLKFCIDEKGLWYNQRLEEETKKRNEFTESRRINGNLGGRPKNKKPNAKAKQNLMDNHKVNHMEDENVIENDNEILNEYRNWTEKIIDRNDYLFWNIFQNEKLPISDNTEFWVRDHLDLLNRYPKMRPPNQQAFRQSCIKHIRENFKKEINGKQKLNSKELDTAASIDFVAKHYSTNASGK